MASFHSNLETHMPRTYPPYSHHLKELPSEGTQPHLDEGSSGVNREEPRGESKAVGTG